MTEVRTKDKLFLAVAVPIALIAAYVYCWRIGSAAKIARLEGKLATLVTEEDYPSEMAAAARSEKSANDELAAEKTEPMPPPKVVGNAEAREAERELAILKVFREEELQVVRCAADERADQRDERAPSALRGTGLCENPRRRVYELVGMYPSVVRALEMLAERKLAIIPESVTMQSKSDDRWIIAVWL